MLHLAWIVPLLLLTFFLASPRYRGDIAESRVRRILAQGLEKSRYTILNDVVLPSGGGTIRIDHLVVSKFGIFVIKSQYARGWISGGEAQDRWKQYRLGRFTLFDNPVYRTHLQAQALESILQFPGRAFHRVVVMVGQKGFRHDMPLNVIEPEKLIASLRKRGEHILSSEQAARALKGIESARIEPRSGILVNRLTLVRLLLLALLGSGIYLAFGEDFLHLKETWSRQSEMRSSPGDFHPDGRKKTEHELWEDSLRCAYSVDTGRCTCFEPDGARADVGLEKCRELAERGSILRQ